MGNIYYNEMKTLFGGKIIGAIIVEWNDNGEEKIKVMNGHTNFSTNQETMFPGFLIKMPDGTIKGMIIMQDDEGNGPGTIDVVNLKMLPAALKKLLTKAIEGEKDEISSKK